VNRRKIYNGYIKRPFPNGHKCPFGCSGYVTAVAAGQSQRLYSGVGIFNWHYPSSPPQILRFPMVPLERRGLIYQWLRFIFDPSPHLTALEEAEIIPGKDSDTRIKPFALTNGHGRYMTVTPERTTLTSVEGFPLNIWPLNFWPFHF
jgi:hypothetical protein